MHHHPVNLVEFCAGYCGIGIGLKSVVGDLRTIAYVEREAYAVANLVSKIEAGRLDAAPIWSDLLDFPYGKFRGVVDIATAGIPCQPHSHAGLRKGGGDERFLFNDWLTGLQQMRPRCIFIENVEGLLTSRMPDGTLCIRWTLERLERMGYRTASGIFSAEECGAPHIRKRIWILAYADGERGQGSECFLRDACEIGQGGRILRRIATLAMRGNGQVGQTIPNDGGNRRERLNPAWVESLLGLPLSWTDCASSATESSPQPPHSHSAL